MDFVFCFCQEYKDEEVFAVISDIKLIAKHYLKGSCLFDFLAIVPFSQLIQVIQQLENENKLRLFHLFKLLRVPRLFGLLNVERFRQSLTSYYNSKLEENVKKNIDSANYPIHR